MLWDARGGEGHELHVLGTPAWLHRAFSMAVRQLLVASLPPSLLLLLELPAGPFWSPSRAFNTCESGSQKRSGWLRGSDVKTMKYGAGVSQKLKGFLWNLSLSLALLKKHILITVKCVCSHLVISLVHFSVWFW